MDRKRGCYVGGCSQSEADANGTPWKRQRSGKEQTKGGHTARGVEKFNCAYFRRDVSQILLLPTTTTTTTITTNTDAADPLRRILKRNDTRAPGI